MNKVILSEAKDLQEIKSLTETCAVALQEKGIFQWSEIYPTLGKLQADIEKKELFLIKDQGKILGIIVLTEFMDKEYIPIHWMTKNGNNLYIHRLAVHPLVWGKGYGKKLMDFAEDYARLNNFASVRLDTFSKNERNQRFYEKRGYQKLGDIYFPKQSEDPFHCYELIL